MNFSTIIYFPKSSQSLFASSLRSNRVFSSFLNPVVGGRRRRASHCCPSAIGLRYSNSRGFSSRLIPVGGRRRASGINFPSSLRYNSSMGAKEAKQSDDKGDDANDATFTQEVSSSTDNDANVDSLASKLEALKVKEEQVPTSLKKVADLIQQKKARRILVLSGAGVSCSAGIPDFRSPGTGLYDNLKKYDLPFPEAVFDLGFYRDNPAPFLNLAKELWPGVKHSPTLTHSFISLLNKKSVLLRNYSQNIDGLEFLADLPNEKLVECHGHFRTASCIECGTESTECETVILTSNEVPKCNDCGGLVKPDIVFFGEDLPQTFHTLLPKDVRQADLLLVMGTSLLVAPVSMIPDMVHCKRVLLNRECVGNFHQARGDVVYEGDCDDAVYMLSKLLGWEEELMELNERTRIGVNEKEEADAGKADKEEKKGVQEDEEEETEAESLEDLCGLGESAKER